MKPLDVSSSVGAVVVVVVFSHVRVMFALFRSFHVGVLMLSNLCCVDSCIRVAPCPDLLYVVTAYVQ